MSGSDQFRLQPRDGTELEGQLTVTDPLGQPAGFTSLSALEQGQNTLQHKRSHVLLHRETHIAATSANLKQTQILGLGERFWRIGTC